jgi:hypothetical protein
MGIAVSDQSDDAQRIMQDKIARASALASRCVGERGWNDPQAMTAAFANAGATLAGFARKPTPRDGKPAFWWAMESEPWKRIRAEIDGAEPCP